MNTLNTWREMMDNTLCVACTDADASVYFIPCLHIAFCESCLLEYLNVHDKKTIHLDDDSHVEKQLQCPICRTVILGFRRSNQIEHLINESVSKIIDEKLMNKLFEKNDNLQIMQSWEKTKQKEIDENKPLQQYIDKIKRLNNLNNLNNLRTC